LLSDAPDAIDGRRRFVYLNGTVSELMRVTRRQLTDMHFSCGEELMACYEHLFPWSMISEWTMDHHPRPSTTNRIFVIRTFC
jgi:hypothetical protein